MRKGNLLKVVQDDSTITTLDLLQMAKQAAAGMAYLEQQHIIHRDLALRNLLVAVSDNPKYIIKVAGNKFMELNLIDFGLSRSLSEKQYYETKNSPFPVKWTARKHQYFHLLLAEVFTMAKYSHQSGRFSLH